MKRTLVALALLFVSSVVALSVTSENSGGEIVEAAPHVRATVLQAGENRPSEAGVSIASLRSRGELFGATHDRRNLFDGPTVVPPLPSAAPALTEVPPLPTPAAPTLPFTYIGKKAADGVWEVYLARGQETLIVHEQAVIDSTYRVESILPPTLSILYLPLKQVQTLDIGSAN